MFTATEILDIAIRLEKNGEKTYRDAMKTVSDPEILSMLNWMAGEEAAHAQWFAELKDGCETGERNPLAEEMGRGMLEDLLDGQVFSLQEVDFSKIRRLGELVEIFIEFEEDTILFYQFLESFVQEDTPLRQLKKIISEEHRHVEKLKSLLHDDTLLAVV